MKKLFTLTLVLLVTFVGYSQVKSLSTKNGMSKMATQQRVGRTDNVNAYVESHPNMVRDFSTGELDYTTYDWQTNASIINRTIVWPDNKVNFAYTMATAENFSDRGTGIGTYDYNNDEWIPLEGRAETEKPVSVPSAATRRTASSSLLTPTPNAVSTSLRTETTWHPTVFLAPSHLTPPSTPAGLS